MQALFYRLVTWALAYNSSPVIDDPVGVDKIAETLKGG